MATLRWTVEETREVTVYADNPVSAVEVAAEFLSGKKDGLEVRTTEIRAREPY